MVDELWSGVAVVAAPEVETFHEVSHAQYTLWVFAVPMLLSSLIEAPIALVSDRLPRQRLLASGLAMLAASLALAAFATTPWFLAAALSLAGAASGVACDSAQAELITRHPGGAAPAMARWLVFAAAGDALVPLVIAAVYWIGGTHRSALCVCALILAAQAFTAYRSAPAPDGNASPPDGNAPASEGNLPVPVPPEHEYEYEHEHEHEHEHEYEHEYEPTDPEETAPLPLRAALAAAARKPRLWLFLFGASACTLLDEVVVALGALRLHQDLGWTESEAALVMTGLSSGAVLGALVSERLLKTISSRRLLIFAAAGSCILLAVVVTTTSAPLIVTALFCLGMTCALHWPLVKAAAYELVPGQPGVVNALQQAFVGMDIALPLLVGLIASHFGLATALASLAIEPIILLFVAAFWRSDCPEVAPRATRPPSA